MGIFDWLKRKKTNETAKGNEEAKSSVLEPSKSESDSVKPEPEKVSTESTESMNLAADDNVKSVVENDVRASWQTVENEVKATEPAAVEVDTKSIEEESAKAIESAVKVEAKSISEETTKAIEPVVEAEAKLIEEETVKAVEPAVEAKPSKEESTKVVEPAVEVGANPIEETTVKAVEPAVEVEAKPISEEATKVIEPAIEAEIKPIEPAVEAKATVEEAAKPIEKGSAKVVEPTVEVKSNPIKEDSAKAIQPSADNIKPVETESETQPIIQEHQKEKQENTENKAKFGFLNRLKSEKKETISDETVKSTQESVFEQNSEETDSALASDISNEEPLSDMEESAIEEKPSKKGKGFGFFSKLVSGLAKTRNSIATSLNNVFSANHIDEDFYEELEEILIMADMGVETTMNTLDELREAVKKQHIKEPADCKDLLIDIIKNQMSLEPNAYDFENQKSVVMIIGVNGVGKTTSIGKLASQFRKNKKKVIMAAADTFRAAAIEQLTEWAHRSQVDIISQKEGADPSAVVYDALQAAKARNADILLIDTAGRLHNKKNLMDELSKMNRIIDREYPGAYKETLIVLDGTTGQNALEQAKQFKQVADIDGIILTKLDGTAKGGIAIAIHSELGVPVKYIGVGEGIDDLQKFDPEAYVNAIFTTEDVES